MSKQYDSDFEKLVSDNATLIQNILIAERENQKFKLANGQVCPTQFYHLLKWCRTPTMKSPE